jgi:hypothetical protein
VGQFFGAGSRVHVSFQIRVVIPGQNLIRTLNPGRPINPIDWIA